MFSSKPRSRIASTVLPAHLRHGAGDAEPAGAPGSAPAGAHLDGLGVGCESLGDRHGLAGGVPHRDVQRHGLGVHGGADALVEDALEAGFDQVAVVMHAGAPGSVEAVGYQGWVTVAGADVVYSSPRRASNRAARSSCSGRRPPANQARWQVPPSGGCRRAAHAVEGVVPYVRRGGGSRRTAGLRRSRR